MSEIEDKMVFGVCPNGQGDGVPMVLLGIPAGAWEYMRDGKTHHFDLTRVGLPVKVMLFGAADHAAAIKVVHEHNKSLGLSTLDLRREDFSIHPLKDPKS